MTRLRRTMLYMPGDSLRKIQKGASIQVDSIIMDLEDGVAFSQKEQGRITVTEALQTLDFGSSERLVRINPMSSEFAKDDFEGTVAAHPDGYVIPKVESPEEVIEISDWLTHIEGKNGWELRSINLFAIIETSLGLINLRDIVESSRRLKAVMFGAQDFASSVGAIRSEDGHELLYARSQLITYTKAFGLQAIDTPHLAIDDLEGLADETRRMMNLGFDGKMVIHPKQIPVIEKVYMPSDDEIEYATALIKTFQEHQSAGKSVFAFRGKMVDMPNIVSARQVLARAGISLD